MLSPWSRTSINIKTKREVLVEIAPVYDPLAYLSTAMTKMKVFLQILWKEGKGWDHEMTSDHFKEQKAMQEFRCHHRNRGTMKCWKWKMWLLGFCNASKDTYPTTVYLRTGNSGNIFSHLLYSKTKQEPKKNSISLPRLELLAVLIGIRCMKFVAKEIHLKIEKKIIWTDSQCILNWIKNNKPLSIFVKNCIDEIRSEPDIFFILQTYLLEESQLRV